MRLRHGERILRSEYAVLEGGIHPQSARGPGVLYLTNRRIAFEEGRAARTLRGRAAPSLPVNASLHEVEEATVSRRRIRSPRLVVVLRTGRPAFDVLDPEGWSDAIRDALAAPTTPAVVERVTVERQVVKVRCRYCGSLGNEVDGRCPSCGAPL